MVYKVGDVAKRTGITIRTLYYYDEMGLLKPSLVNGAGHRLYNIDDLKRLQKIVLLKQMGFALKDIQASYDLSEEQDYARQWQELLSGFTGGDAGISQSLKTIYENEPGTHTMHGMNGVTRDVANHEESHGSLERGIEVIRSLGNSSALLVLSGQDCLTSWKTRYGRSVRSETHQSDRCSVFQQSGKPERGVGIVCSLHTCHDARRHRMHWGDWQIRRRPNLLPVP